MLSFVNWLTLSGGAEQSGQRGPSTENQEAKQSALLCIKVYAHCTDRISPLHFFAEGLSS